MLCVEAAAPGFRQSVDNSLDSILEPRLPNVDPLPASLNHSIHPTPPAKHSLLGKLCVLCVLCVRHPSYGIS